MNLLHTTQLALTLGAFLGQNVTSEGLFVFEAIRRLLKALGCSTVSFNFWHFGLTVVSRLVAFAGIMYRPTVRLEASVLTAFLCVIVGCGDDDGQQNPPVQWPAECAGTADTNACLSITVTSTSSVVNAATSSAAVQKLAQIFGVSVPEDFIVDVFAQLLDGAAVGFPLDADEQVCR